MGYKVKLWDIDLMNDRQAGPLITLLIFKFGPELLRKLTLKQGIYFSRVAVIKWKKIIGCFYPWDKCFPTQFTALQLLCVTLSGGGLGVGRQGLHLQPKNRVLSYSKVLWCCFYYHIVAVRINGFLQYVFLWFLMIQWVVGELWQKQKSTEREGFPLRQMKQYQGACKI